MKPIFISTVKPKLKIRKAERKIWSNLSAQVENAFESTCNYSTNVNRKEEKFPTSGIFIIKQINTFK